MKYRRRVVIHFTDYGNIKVRCPLASIGDGSHLLTLNDKAMSLFIEKICKRSVIKRFFHILLDELRFFLNQ